MSNPKPLYPSTLGAQDLVNVEADVHVGQRGVQDLEVGICHVLEH